MTENTITPEFRATYVGLFKATAPKDNPEGKKKFTVRAAFPPDADLTQLKHEAAQAVKDKWGDKKPSTLRSPFRLNGELDNPIPGLSDDWIVVTFAANEDRRPGVVDESLQDIIDDSLVYSGSWGRAQVRAYAYENAGNRGVSFGLQNYQRTRDDEPLGAGRMPASKAFSQFKSSSPAGKSTADIFG